MKTYTVYKHTNKSNGKIYIGITSMNPKKRWKNGWGYKPQKENSSRFWNAIQKYGWDNFEHEILYENLEELQAKTLEISLIRFYDSTDPDKGYNISAGGEGSSGCKRSDETRKKMSENHRGGRLKHSDESKKKISESQRKQPIICIETGIEYDSYMDAERKTGFNNGHIRLSCIKGYACKGLHFKKIE